ncbi:MAG: class I SAM-dependent methyltransferase [Anaerolineae bacterium]
MNLDEYARMYVSEDTHWWYVGMRDITASILNGHLRAPRILDVGCGTGGLLARLQENGWAVGVDLSDVALQFAQRRGLRNLADASIEALPFKSESFDMLTCMDVLYHLQVQEDVAALRECYRVLRPGGWFLIKVPAFESLRGEHDRTVHTRHRYTVEELRGKCEAAGFRVERATYANTFLLPVAAAKRILEPVIPLAPTGSSDVAMGPPWLNSILTQVLRTEARLVKHVDFPVGLTAVALAQRPPL